VDTETIPNWKIWITSPIPGLAFFLLGFPGMGAAVALATGALLAILWFFPDPVSWHLFGTAYLVQMAYAVGKSVYNNTPITEITPNSNLTRRLPEQFSNQQTLEDDVFTSLSKVMGNDEELEFATIGLEQNSLSYIFIGVTHDHLILSEASQVGNPIYPTRLPKEQVNWVSLAAGERNMLFSIDIDGKDKLSLHVPGKLKEDTILILKEFPGTWTEEKGLENLPSNPQPGSKIGRTLLFAVLILLFMASIGQSNNFQSVSHRIIENLSVALIFFIIGFLTFIDLVKRFKTEPGFTTVNIIHSFSAVSWIGEWIFSLYLTGNVAVWLIKYLRSMG
jgi:hypothetical protein